MIISVAVRQRSEVEQLKGKTNNVETSVSKDVTNEIENTNCEETNVAEREKSTTDSENQLLVPEESNTEEQPTNEVNKKILLKKQAATGSWPISNGY